MGGVPGGRGRIPLVAGIVAGTVACAVAALVLAPAAAASTRPSPAATERPGEPRAVGLPDPLYPARPDAPALPTPAISAASVLLTLPPAPGLPAASPGPWWGVVSDDGRQYGLLQAAPVEGTRPVLSPDGRAVAWWTGVDGDGVQVRELAAAGTTAVRLPRGVRDVGLQWYPDGRRLLVTAVEVDGRASVWMGDPRTAAAARLCRCDDRLLVSASGGLVAVPGPSLTGLPGDPAPAAAVVLPRAGTRDVVVRPDGRAWAAIGSAPDRLAIGERGRGVREVRVPSGGSGIDSVLAWTRDGVWIGVPALGVVLVDPATGLGRTVAGTAAGPVTVAGLAVSLATGARTVTAAPPPERRRVGPEDDDEFGTLDKLHYLFVWLPLTAFGPAGVAIGLGLVAAVVAVGVHRAVRRRRLTAGARP